jgi:hypothetical protein
MLGLRLRVTLAAVLTLHTTTLLIAQTDNKDEPKKSVTQAKPIEVTVADGKLTLQVPGSWLKETPKFAMIESEFKIPAADGDALPGRMTIMGSGGTVEANIDRWVGQFTQPDDKDSNDATKIEKKTISDTTVHLVEISGTYLDAAGGPLGPKTEREDYMMLGAIIETPDSGNYYVKSYGGSKTMKANQENFKKMIASLKIKRD